MILKHGDMWKSKADIVLFTGNAFIREDGCLVMGRGAALEAQNKYNGCNKVFGELILVHRKKFGLGIPYGVILHPNLEIGVFQVKWNFWDDALLSLIQHSAAILKTIANNHNGLNIALNFPGIGFGRLSGASVLPILEQLPDNVEVWKYDKSG